MANQQASTSKRAQGGAKPAQGSTARSGGSSSTAGTSRTNGDLVERDETYGLISVLYHALQGAETYTQYIEDARRAQDQELQSFFQECLSQENEKARRARQLLASRLGEGMDDEDDEDEDDDDDDDES